MLVDRTTLAVVMQWRSRWWRGQGRAVAVAVAAAGAGAAGAWR